MREHSNIVQAGLILALSPIASICLQMHLLERHCTMTERFTSAGDLQSLLLGLFDLTRHFYVYHLVPPRSKIKYIS